MKSFRRIFWTRLDFSTEIFHDNLGDSLLHGLLQVWYWKALQKFVDINCCALIARGKTVDDPTGLLFDDYFAVKDNIFAKYMKKKQYEYFDDQEHMKEIIHNSLIPTNNTTFLRKKYASRNL